MEYIRIGHVMKPFGLDGTVKVFSMTDFPKQRLKVGNVLSFLNEKTGERKEYVVQHARIQKTEYYLKVEGINTPEDADQLRNLFIEINKDNAPLPKGFVRFEDMKGCAVVDEEDKPLGTVIDVKDTGTLNIVCEKEDGSIFYVPYVKKVFVLDVNIETKIVKIHVIPGLL
ncbi:MAG: ribosome maturation factor RimM [Bacilli bacterium]|nr:ribosome maturation factor RimM [Bacilli bacterium]